MNRIEKSLRAQLRALDVDNNKLRQQVDELKECQKWQGIAEHRQTVIDSKNIEIEKLKLDSLHLSDDLNYYQAIMDGSWPSAREQLEKALANINTLNKVESE
jgi:SMC interacting uncharacterized protein involved in chromosome segregation